MDVNNEGGTVASHAQKENGENARFDHYISVSKTSHVWRYAVYYLFITEAPDKFDFIQNCLNFIFLFCWVL